MTMASQLATDHQLLQAYEESLTQLEENRVIAGHLEMEIMQRIKARGGTSLPNVGENGEQIWQCELVETFTYDQAAFTPLLERFNKTELDACYVPAHQETVDVPAKWLTQQVKSIANKHGDGAPEIVDRARMPKDRKLKFKRIEK